MKNKLSILSCLIVVSLTSCGQADAPHRATNGNANQAQKVKSPAMLIARVKSADLNKQSGKIEIVSLAGATSIKSGDDAARAFASGKPMSVRQTSNGPEAFNEDAAILLDTKKSTGMALDASSIVSTLAWMGNTAQSVGGLGTTLNGFMTTFQPFLSMLGV
ncbi:MAG: hypothetical protein WCO71_13520, partial [Pseudomonadota bacterium]